MLCKCRCAIFNTYILRKIIIWVEIHFAFVHEMMEKSLYIIYCPNMGILAIIHDQSNFSLPPKLCKKIIGRNKVEMKLKTNFG